MKTPNQPTTRTYTIPASISNQIKMLSNEEHLRIQEHLKTILLRRYYYKLFKSLFGLALMFLFALGFVLFSTI